MVPACDSTPRFSADKPPSGSNWFHEIKHDGFRLMARVVTRLASGLSPAEVTTGRNDIRWWPRP